METEAVLVRVWELHDKVSDAIQAIFRANFLRSVEAPCSRRQPEAGGGEDAGEGMQRFVLVNDFSGDEDDAAMADARSLGAIRFALENLEDQIQFFHVIQLQQQTERNAAIARLEQSRAHLAVRLADHQGKKFKVIEEALELVSDVVAPEVLYENGVTRSQSGKNSKGQEVTGPSMSLQTLISNFAIATKSFKLVRIHGVLGNVAKCTVCMLAFLQLNQLIFKGETGQARGQIFCRRRTKRNSFRLDNSSHNSILNPVDVWSARG